VDAEALRALQAPLKSRYRDEPNAALITLRAEGDIDDAKIACKVETGRALVTAGLHPATGGSGLEACSGDMLLEALVACAGLTLKAVATAIGVELRSAHVSAEGNLDFRGTLGVDREATAITRLHGSPVRFATSPFILAISFARPLQERGSAAWNREPIAGGNVEHLARPDDGKGSGRRLRSGQQCAF
jgi:uncharacterized OsmC-like protein